MTEAGFSYGSRFFFYFYLPPGHHHDADDGDDSPGNLQYSWQDREVDHRADHYEETACCLDDHGAGSLNEFQCRIHGQSREEGSKDGSGNHIEDCTSRNSQAVLADNNCDKSEREQINHPVDCQDAGMEFFDILFGKDSADGKQ